VLRPLRPGWLAALAAAGGLAALGLVWMSANGAGGRPAAPPPAPQQATERRCTRPSPQALQALKRGDLRLVVVLTAFEPAAPGPGLVVSLSTGTASPRRRHELARIAVHPPRAFTPDQPQHRQRFFVPVARHAAWIADDQPLCLELGFDPRAGGAGVGRLGFDIELVEVPRPG
jgi:hypothetical protein